MDPEDLIPETFAASNDVMIRALLDLPGGHHRLEGLPGVRRPGLPRQRSTSLQEEETRGILKMKQLVNSSLGLLLAGVAVYAVFWFSGPKFDLWLPPRGPCDGGLVKVKQKRTISDLGTTGSAFLAWAKGQQIAVTPSEGVARVDVNDYRPTSYLEIYDLLHPRDDFFFIQEVPQVDGWGHPLEFRLAGKPGSPTGFLIRSPGCNGTYETDSYQVGPFLGTDHGQDIIWVDGAFSRWPGTPGDRPP